MASSLPPRGSYLVIFSSLPLQTFPFVSRVLLFASELAGIRNAVSGDGAAAAVAAEEGERGDRAARDGAQGGAAPERAVGHQQRRGGGRARGRVQWEGRRGAAACREDEGQEQERFQGLFRRPAGLYWLGFCTFVADLEAFS